jgi:hypothetical protein
VIALGLTPDLPRGGKCAPSSGRPRDRVVPGSRRVAGGTYTPPPYIGCYEDAYN